MTDLEVRQERFAQDFGLTLAQYKKLASAVTADELISCLELLKAKTHRSQFRASVASSLKQWIEHGGMLKPLSINQMKAIVPKWPIKIQVPV